MTAEFGEGGYERGPFDEDDAVRIINSIYPYEVSRSDVDEAFHGAREDARRDPRSRDPNDISYTGDWSRPEPSPSRGR